MAIDAAIGYHAVHEMWSSSVHWKFVDLHWQKAMIAEKNLVGSQPTVVTLYGSGGHQVGEA
jgi:hypothetical protein